MKKKLISLLAAIAMLSADNITAGPNPPDYRDNGPETFTFTLRNTPGFQQFKVVATADFKTWRTIATFHKGEASVTVTDRHTKNRRYQFYTLVPLGR